MSVRIARLAFGLTAAFLLAPSLTRATLSIKTAVPGNIFLTTETPQIPCATTGNQLTWSVRDYFGVTLKSGTVLPQNGQATIQPDLGRTGYFELDLTESLNGAVTAQRTAAFAVLAPFTPPASATPSFGAQTHLAQYDNIALLPILARAGLTHIRDEQYWNLIESQAGVFNYPAQFTNYMSAAAAQGLTPLLILDWGNPLYNGSTSVFTAPATDTDRAAYANYAANLLARYGTQVKAFEVWNEFNAGTYVDGTAATNKPYYYAQLLQRTYQTVKAARPDVQIVAGATVPVAHGFLQNVFKNGGMPYLDVVSVHPYRGYPAGVDLDIRGLRDLIKTYNNGVEKPIWATEFSLNATTADQRIDAAVYLAQITSLMLSERVERVYYYLSRCSSEYPYRGLLGYPNDARGAYAPNPAYVVYANLIRQLSGATIQGRVAGTSASTYAFKFTAAGNTPLHVLWSVLPLTVKLQTTSSLVVTDTMGQTRTLAPANGVVSLPLTRDVQYVRGTISGLTEVNNTLLADSLSGYSRTQAENGWSYGYASLKPTDPYASSQFKPMKWAIFASDNYRWLGSSSYNFNDVAQLHPYSAWAIRRWTSTYAGSVTLTGTARCNSASYDGTNLRFFVDGREVYSRHLAPGESITYSVPNVAVTVGSQIDFTVNQSGNANNDATAFTALITRP